MPNSPSHLADKLSNNDIKIKLAMILGPIWFGIIVFFAGSLTPGYSQSTQTISELAIPGAPYELFVRFAGFLPLGLLVIAFALSVRAYVKPRFAQITVFLLLCAGIAIIIAGIFPTDFKGRRESLSGLLHAIFGIVILLTGSLTPLNVALFGANQRISSIFRVYSLLTGITLCILFILIPNGLSPQLIALHHLILGEDLFKFWYTYYGLHQRLFLLIYFLWLAIFAQLAFPKNYPIAEQG